MSSLNLNTIQATLCDFKGRDARRTRRRKFAAVDSRFRHGGWHTPEYAAYNSAKNRCTNPKNADWSDYGGRGIGFLFASFPKFLAELGPRPSPQHSPDRIDNASHYMPGNCRWATRKEQAENRGQYKALRNSSDEALLAECKRRGLPRA